MSQHPFNVEAEEKRQVKEDKRRLELQKARYQRTFSTSYGKEVLWDLLSQAQIFSDAHEGDQHLRDRALGARAMGLYILEQVTLADPKIFPNLLLERGMPDGTSTDK